MRRTFPDFLRSDFEELELAAQPASIVVIDHQGTILWVNEAWQRFAEENGAAEACRSWTSYFDPIQPLELREHYVRRFAEALATGVPFEEDYECSSPEVARHYHLRALPIAPHGLLVEHSLISAELHVVEGEVRPDVEATYLDRRGLIVQCANCRRIHHPTSTAWHWGGVKWARAGDRRLSHGICPSCAGFYWSRRRGKRS